MLATGKGIDPNTNFSKWRSRLWPVHFNELKAFLPLFFLKFCVSFNYTILTATKDTVVVTARDSGAEVIPVLKGGVVLITAFFAMLAYSKLSNKLSRISLFYAVLLPFVIFFLLYGFVLFPNKDLLSPHQSANWLLSIIGVEHKHWIAVYRNWMDSLFFVLTELWGGMMIGLIFWGFANQITNVKNAARFYTLYTAGGQIGTIFAGFIIYNYATHATGNFTTTIAILMGIVIFICFVIAAIYWWTNYYVINQPGFAINIPQKEHLKDSRTKLSLLDSLFFIIRSPYLGSIAMMVIGYGISINLIEVSWKAMLKLQFPDPTNYQAYMGVVQTILGAFSLFIAMFVGGNIIRRYGWYASAQLTPIVLGITSLLFFIAYFIFPNYSANTSVIWQMQIPEISCKLLGITWHIIRTKLIFITPLALLVFLGTIHNIACKTMKYCLFDTTKEMAYIPLDKEAKIKGKAAVDLVGARFGKSGASWTQLILIEYIGAGSILGVLPLLFPCVAVVLLFWIFAVRSLNTRFSNLQNNNTAFTLT